MAVALSYLEEIMDKKGFTVVELLVTIVVLSVLAAISIPIFASYRINAYNSTALSDLKNVKSQIELYYHDNGFYP
jgi:type IV pilus assembly protein PilA